MFLGTGVSGSSGFSERRFGDLLDAENVRV